MTYILSSIAETAKIKIRECVKLSLACENIRFSSLFAAGDVPSGEERGETDVFAGVKWSLTTYERLKQ